MADVTIYESEYITVKLMADKGIIAHKIHQPVSGQPLRDALNAGTEAMRKYGVCKWLSDDRDNAELPKADREWGFTDWNMRTIKAGWKYWAMVIPQDMYAAGTLTQTIDDLYEHGLRIMVFTNHDEAIAWLDSLEC